MTANRFTKAVAFTIGFVCACGLLAAPAQSAVLSGKATIGGKAVAGVSVQAFPASTLTLGGTPPFQSKASGENGEFHLELPAGEYYLLADGTELFSYYGRNPVTVPADGLNGINLLMVGRAGTLPKAPAQIEGGIQGAVTRDGKPVAGAVAFIYPDLSSQLKGFGLGMATPTDEHGVFEMALPAGNYYLVVRQRKDGALAGPMRAGDLFGYLPGNPLQIGEKQVVQVHVPLIEVPDKVERFAATLFGNTSISGRIVDKQGQPVVGISAMLYDDKAMLNRPLFVAQPSDAQGRFILSFPRGGTYFLAARNTLGGTPQPGELYGRFAGEADASIQVKTGQVLKDITLVVEPVW